MRRTMILRAVGALTLALLLAVGWAGAALAQAGDVIDDPGVLITGVVADSPAATAGLVRGDVILAVDGVPVDDAQALAAAVQAVEPGATVELTIRHGDEERTLPVAVAEVDGRSFLGVRPYVEEESLPPQEEPAEVITAVPITETGELTGTESITAEAVAAALAQAEAVSAEPEGVAVGAVLPASPAEAAGLAPGDLIFAVDGITVTSAAYLVDVIAGYAPGDQVVLSVQPAGESEVQPVAVTLAGRPDDDDEAYLGVSVAPGVDADVYEDRDEDHEWNDEDGWECPFDDGSGYPRHGQRGWWRRPMLPNYGHHAHGHHGWHCPQAWPYEDHSYGHNGWQDPSVMPHDGRRTPWRIPYPGQDYGWHR